MRSMKFRYLRFFIIFCTVATCLTLAAPSDAAAADSRANLIANRLLKYDADVIKNDPAAIIEKFNKIAISPFSFYRGTAVLFYRDLADKSMSLSDKDGEFTTNDLDKCYINGDLHIANFGFARNSEDAVQFDSNDFDESYIASYMLDIKRLAASIVLMARENGAGESESELLDSFFDSFIKKIRKFNAGDDASKYALTLKNAEGFIRETMEKLDEKKRRDLLEKYTAMQSPNGFLENDELKAVDNNTFSVVSDAFSKQYVPGVVKRSPSSYGDGYFKILDIREKLHSGTGSLGLARYYILIGGNTPGGCEKNLVIEMKKERDSVVMPFTQGQSSLAAAFKNNARRALLGTYSMASNVSPFVGTVELSNGSYLLREISPQKESPKFEKMDRKDFVCLCEAAGKIYAKMLVKCANPKSTPHAAQLLAKLDTPEKIENFKKYMKEFAVRYAEIVENDYKLYMTQKDALIKQLEKNSIKSNFIKK